MKCQLNDRNVHSILMQGLDELQHPKQQRMNQNCPKITNQNRVPRGEFVHHLFANVFVNDFDENQLKPVCPESVVIKWNLLSGLILRKEILPLESPTKHCRESSSSANDIAHAGKW